MVYIGDALGSVLQTLDDAGAVVGSIAYDPWGVPTAGTLSTPFGFTGELHSAGQVYLRARWYAPGQGTFTSSDPFAGFPETPYSLHPYQYAYSNPIHLVDPSGTSPWRPTKAEGIYIQTVIQMDFLLQFPVEIAYGYNRGGEMEKERWYTDGFVDIADNKHRLYYEIKSNSDRGRREGITDLQRDDIGFNHPLFRPDQRWSPGRMYTIKANYGLWPYGLDPNYQPQKPGHKYFIIKAKYYQDGLIVYWGEPLDTPEERKSYKYNPQTVEARIAATYPSNKNYRQEGKHAQPIPDPIVQSDLPCKMWLDGICIENYEPVDAFIYGFHVVDPPIAQRVSVRIPLRFQFRCPLPLPLAP
jgi:RHS repeat-associated protein